MDAVLDVQEVQQQLDRAAHDATHGPADIRAGRFVHGSDMVTTPTREISHQSGIKFSAEQAAQSYLLLFWEAINRANFVGSILNNGTNIPSPITLEICYLQFRKICEMIALGSLFLHGDLPETEKLTGEWNAEQIMKKLARLHPNFFPHSATIVLDTSSGNRVWKVEQDTNPNAIKQNEVTNLYNKCGDILHRGKIKTLDFTVFPETTAFVEMRSWQEKIVALLNSHLIMRANRMGFYLFNAQDADGKPSCSVGEYKNGGVVLHNIRTTFKP
jgi:hypothetical protein